MILSLFKLSANFEKTTAYFSVSWDLMRIDRFPRNYEKYIKYSSHFDVAGFAQTKKVLELIAVQADEIEFSRCLIA